MLRITIFLIGISLTFCQSSNFNTVNLNKSIKVNLKNKVEIDYNFEKIYYEKNLEYMFFRLIVKEKFLTQGNKIYFNSFFKVRVNGKDMFLTLDENGTSEPVSSQWRCRLSQDNINFTRTYAVHNLDASKDFLSLPANKFIFEIIDPGYRFSKSELKSKDLDEGFEDCSE